MLTMVNREATEEELARIEENEANAPQANAPQVTFEKSLSPNELYALIVVEQKSIEFTETRLVAATKALEQVDAQLAFWNNKRNEAVAGVIEVRGAISGCKALVTEELEKLGVSNETFERQKEFYFAELEASKKE